MFRYIIYMYIYIYIIYIYIYICNVFIKSRMSCERLMYVEGRSCAYQGVKTCINSKDSNTEYQKQFLYEF